MPESREMTRNELVAAKWVVNNDEGWAACVGHPSGPRLTEQLGKLLDGAEAPLLARIAELERERDALRSEVERLRAEARWVPCSERMPEGHSLVLVTVTGLGQDDSLRFTGVAWVSAGKWIGGGSGRPIVHQTVVAWRPLPAPYTQEDSNAT